MSRNVMGLDEFQSNLRDSTSSDDIASPFLRFICFFNAFQFQNPTNLFLINNETQLKSQTVWITH